MFPTMSPQHIKADKGFFLRQQQKRYGQGGFFHTEQPEQQQNKTKRTTLGGELAEAQTPSWALIQPRSFLF